MQSIILAGGKGTRLRPLTVYTPKPIVPVVNRPFLLYQLEILRRAAITDITLSLNYQPDKIEHLLSGGLEQGVNLRYVTEPLPMGTGGAYKFASENLRETTVVLNGDILTDVDISDVIKFHREKGASATIVLTPVPNPSAYGLVETGPDGRVLKFLEKPGAEVLEKVAVNEINAGIYVLEPDVLDLIPVGENCSFEYDVFPKLLKSNGNFFAYLLRNDYWCDIGTTASYLQAHHDFLDGKLRGFDVRRTNNSDIATAASIDSRSVIGDECIIKPNARVMNSVIGEGVQIEEKVLIENSVIWPRTRINTAAEIRNAVVGKGCYIGRNAILRPGVVLGDKTALTDYTKV